MNPASSGKFFRAPPAPRQSFVSERTAIGIYDSGAGIRFRVREISRDKNFPQKKKFVGYCPDTRPAFPEPGKDSRSPNYQKKSRFPAWKFIEMSAPLDSWGKTPRRILRGYSCFSAAFPRSHIYFPFYFFFRLWTPARTRNFLTGFPGKVRRPGRDFSGGQLAQAITRNKFN